MIKNYLTKWILIFFIGIPSLLWAQDLRFSQYYAAPLVLNPALTGLEKDVYLGVNYRSQNLAENAFNSGQFGFIYPIIMKGQEQNHVGGVGLSLVNENSGQFGEVRRFHGALSAAYNLKLDFYGVHYISMGLQAFADQMTMNFAQLNWASQVTFDGFDSSIPVDMPFENVMFFGFNTGINWVYNASRKRYRSGPQIKAFSGIAVSNLNRPDQSLFQDGTARLPMLYKWHGGIQATLNPNFSISPNFFILSQNQFFQANLGTSLIYHGVFKDNDRQIIRSIDFQVGTWYRVMDSFILLMGFNSDVISGAVSYDLNTSAIAAQIPGRTTLEISLAYRIIKNTQISRVSTPLF